MAHYRNSEHYNVAGDKTVRVTLVFDSPEATSDPVVMRDAADYLKFLADTGSHKSWGREIEVEVL